MLKLFYYLEDIYTFYEKLGANTSNYNAHSNFGVVSRQSKN